MAKRAASSRSSVAILIIVNLLPIFGVLYGGWDVFAVLVLFWVENLVVGALAIARLFFVERRLVTPVFFVVHYGGFCAAHAAILVSLFGPEPAGGAGGIVRAISAVVGTTEVAIVVLALLGSHLWSFFDNYLRRREFAQLDRRRAMQMPYQRIFITQFALIGGGFFLQRFNEPLGGLVLLVVVKTVLDVTAHRREHKRLAPGIPDYS